METGGQVGFHIWLAHLMIMDGPSFENLYQFRALQNGQPGPNGSLYKRPQSP